MLRRDITPTGRTFLNVAGSLIGLSLLGIFAFLTWALVYEEIPPGNETVLNVLLGILSTQVGLVVGFFFGSNVANKQQTETIDTLAQTAKRAGEELAPTKPEPTIKIEPGESATVKAEEK